MGEATSTDCLQGRKAWWTSDTRQPKRDIAEMLRCGEMVPKELSERVHDCPRCGLVMDRDVNAARNILERGLEQARVEAKPLLVQRRRISKFGR